MKIVEFPACVLWVASVLSVTFAVPVQADQNDPELVGLFAQLRQTDEQSEAAHLENLIWQRWLQTPDEQSDELMTQISQAMAGADLAVALEYSDQLVKSHPLFAEGWNKRATLHYMLGNNAESVADIRQTIALEPRHFGAISGLGLIFLREQNFEAALEAFEQVLAISPGSASVRRTVDRLSAELGREI